MNEIKAKDVVLPPDFWEKEVKPDSIPALDSLRAEVMERISAPIQFEAAYDPATPALDKLLCESIHEVHVTWYERMYLFPLGRVGYFGASTTKFHGYLSKFTPTETEEGESLEATITITPTEGEQ